MKSSIEENGLERSQSPVLLGLIRDRVPVLCFTGLGSVLRLLYLGRKSFWPDEIATARIASVPFPEFLRWLWRFEANMSLYYLFVRLWIHFGNSESWFRLLSALFAISSIPLICILGVEVSGKKTGLISALLLSINVAHVAYAQEARSYALLIFLCILSLILFVRMEKGGGMNATAYVTASVLVVYSHFFAVFFLASQWLSLAWLPNKAEWRKRFLPPIASTAVLIAPALYYMLFRRTHQFDYVTPTQLKDLGRLAYFLAADNGRFHKALAIVYLLCLITAIVEVFKPSNSNTDPQRRWSLLVMACCALLPVAITFLLSLRVTMFASRYLLICLPPVIVLVAQGLLELRPRWLRFTATVLILVLTPFTLRWYYAEPKVDFRSVIKYLTHHAQPGDSVAGFPPGTLWYVQCYAPLVAAPTRPKLQYWDANVPQELLADGNSGHERQPVDRLWLITWANAPISKELSTALDSQYERVDQQRFAGPMVLTLYSRHGSGD